MPVSGIGQQARHRTLRVCTAYGRLLCQVCLDFGGRPRLVWDAAFKREKIGEMPTEMFLHFFKSLSDAARMNLNIKAEGQNEHHKIGGNLQKQRQEP